MFNCSSEITGRLARGAALAALGLTVTCGGDAGTTAVAVKPPVAAVGLVDVAPALQTLEVGQTTTLAVTVRTSLGILLTGRTVSWSSNAPSVAVVNSTTGVVTAVGSGSAIISASVEGVTGAATVNVTAPAASVLIDSIVAPLYVGKYALLSLTVRDASNRILTGRPVQWSSSDPSIAAVSADGTVLGVAVGAATITATVDGKSATRVVVVLAIPALVVTLSPSNAFLARGVVFPLATTMTDFYGQPRSGLTATYTTNDPAVATVSATGVVTPVGNGAVAITVTVDGVSATARLIVMDPRTVSGQVMTADGGSPAGLEFSARLGAGAQRFSTPIDRTTGNFSLTIPLFTSSGAALEFYVDAASGSNRRYHPSYLRMAPGLVPTGARILLVPHFITPDSGSYAGQPVPVNLDNAFSAVCSNTADANCQSYWPSYWISGIKMWPDAARPIPLALDRTTSSVSAADSVALWGTIRAVESDLGRQLYKPAMFAVYTSPGYSVGMMLVSRDSAIAPFAGYTNWNWDGQGMLFQAKVRLASTSVFANGSVVSHELTHGQGFSHTCRWSTIMGGYGCGQTSRLSSSDVAYYHLAQMVRAKMIALSPTWSIVESLQGVRVIEFSLAPSDAIPRALVPLLSRGSLPGSDGAP